MAVGKGSPDIVLFENDVISIIEDGIPSHVFENKNILVLTPDATRTCPLPMMAQAVRKTLGHRCARLDFMVALGTHPPMSEIDILALYGITDHRRDFPRSGFSKHEWSTPEEFQRIDPLSALEVGELSEGLLSEEVPVYINRRIFDYDMLLVLGPVFPHEVVGFSGGAKYLFPGISGGEFLHFFHWLGAVITCREIIGKKDTPVRQVINRAMERINLPIHCLAMVVNPEAGLCGLFAGDVKDAWSDAADLSSKIHIVTK